MISHDNNSTDGKSFQDNTENKGSVCTVKVGSRTLPLYPLVIMCLGLLNTLLLLTGIAIGIYCGTVSDISDSQLIPAKSLLIEVKQLQIMQAEAIRDEEEVQKALKKELRSHQQLKLQSEQNKTVSDGFQMQLEILQQGTATLQSDASQIKESCGRCQPGWFLANSSCYFYSKSTSSPFKTWPDSREDCISRGANLTVIETWEEQLNLYEHLPNMVKDFQPWWKRHGGVWIGLTDIQREGSWVWINNVTLQGEGYWILGEPNNYGEGEHCAAIMNFHNPRATWFDGSCLGTKEWLCEMDPN